MKKRKKLIKRIGALLCALVVAVSSLGMSGAYYGAVDMYEDCHEQLHTLVSDSISSLPEGAVLPSSVNGYEYCLVTYRNYYYYVIYSDSPIEPYMLIKEYSYGWAFNYNWWLGECFNEREVYRCHNSSINWSTTYCWESYTEDNQIYYLCGEFHYDIGSFNLHTADSLILYTNYAIYCPCGRIAVPLGELYDSSLGYLQNVSRKSTYIRDILYNYDNDSLTYHWYHDLQSTSGVDLTSGEYKIRHYISNATVKGYEKEDIVEMSEKYLMAEYDASQGYFSYLQKDYLEKIESLGYVDPSWIDIYFKGYFTLQHHYFQIVNTSTNEVGGYLHLYPKDANSDEFGVEMVYEGLDDNFDVDESLQGGIIDDSTGSGTNVEDALENADEPKLDDLSGVEEFIAVVQAYGEEVENVSKGIGAFFGELPPWVIGSIGIGFGLLVVCGIIKALG